MKKFFTSLHKSVSLSAICKYAFLILITVFGNFSAKGRSPLAFALFAGSVSSGFNPFVTGGIFVISQVYPFELWTLISLSVGAIILIAVHYLFKFKNIRYELLNALITAICLLPYVFLADGKLYLTNGIYALITAFLYLPASKALYLLFVKGISAAADGLEILSLSAVTILVSLGCVRLAGVTAWTATAYLALLILSAILSKQNVGIISTVLSLPLALFYVNVTPVGYFLCLALAVYLTADWGKYVQGFTLFLADFLLRYFLSGENALEPIHLSLTAAAVLISFLIPSKWTAAAKNKIYGNLNKTLVKRTVNNERICLADKLYEISSVFSQISKTASEADKVCGDEITARKLAEKLMSSVCVNQKGQPCKDCSLTSKRFDKLIRTGLGKGQVNFIDIPEPLTNGCHKVPQIIFCLNKILAEYKTTLGEESGQKLARELIARQTSAIAELMKGLASETGRLSPIRSDVEKEIAVRLAGQGIGADEIMVFGEGDDITVHLSGDYESKPKQTKVASVTQKITEKKMALTDITPLGKNKTCLTFKPAPKFSLQVGYAAKKKDGSDISGDTFSVTEISPDKTLLAVSDGMGSGKEAEKVSSDALGLIECFYRAGLSGEVITECVNKILAVNQADSFAALDIAAVDLKNGNVSLMKYGAAFSFILSDTGVKIVESGALPMGILGDLKPAVATTPIKEKDIIVMFSDGVSDNFGSTGEMLEYITENITDDPDILAERILAYAVKKDGGVPHDDMTVLCGKIC